jgi:acyl-CoA thioester hydrolase
MILAEIDIRVRYQETDQMSVVYHANYFTWFEAARIELLDRMGCPYRKLEKEGFFLPVLHCEAKFIKPAHFDDRLIVRVFINEPPAARIKINYEVYRSEKLLCTGNSTHAFIDKRGKLVRPPVSFSRSVQDAKAKVL